MDRGAIKICHRRKCMADVDVEPALGFLVLCWYRGVTDCHGLSQIDVVERCTLPTYVERQKFYFQNHVARHHSRRRLGEPMVLG